jgi:hypothetical protein
MKVLILYNEGMRAYCIEYVKSLCIHPDIVAKQINDKTILPTLTCRVLLVNWLHIGEFERMLELNMAYHGVSREELDLGIINLEQLSRSSMLSQYLSVYFRLIHIYPHLQLYDYIQGNIATLESLKISAKLLEYQYRHDEVEKLKSFCSAGPKETDVVMVGCMSSDHRMNIFNCLKEKGVNVKMINNLWEDDRDREIAKAKILLNIHYNPEYQFFESLRCARWIFANKLVITETSGHSENYYLNKYMMIEPYDKIVEKVVETLAFYNESTVNYDIIDSDNAREKLYLALGLL